MAGRVGVNNEGTVVLLHRLAEDGGAQLDSASRRRDQVIHGEIQMELLGRAERPGRALVSIDALERQLDAHSIQAHLAPFRVGRFNVAVEELPIEAGQGDGVRAVNDNGAEAHTGHVIKVVPGPRPRLSELGDTTNLDRVDLGIGTDDEVFHRDLLRCCGVWRGDKQLLVRRA
jgi:hypothetical protein